MSPEEGWGGVRRGIPLVLHPSNCTLKQINHTQTQTLCLTWLEKPPNITRPVTFSLAPSGDTRSPTQPQNDKKKVTRAAIEAVLSDYWEVSELLRELLSLLRLQVNGYACKWILIEMSDSVCWIVEFAHRLNQASLFINFSSCNLQSSSSFLELVLSLVEVCAPSSWTIIKLDY